MPTMRQPTQEELEELVEMEEDARRAADLHEEAEKGDKTDKQDTAFEFPRFENPTPVASPEPKQEGSSQTRPSRPRSTLGSKGDK